MNKEKFLKKLKRHIFDKYGTQAAAGEALGISPPNISSMCTGRRPPSKELLQDMGMKMVKKVTIAYERDK